MEIKINLDQLFSASTDLNSSLDSHSNDLSHSFNASLNNSFDYKYTFNNRIFEPSEEEQQQEEMDYYNESEFESSAKGAKSVKTIRTTHSNRSKVPGERLFYESQLNQIRRNQQRQKAHHQTNAEMKKVMTFVPEINQNSRKMAQRIKIEQKQVIKSKKDNIKPSYEVKEEQQLKQCTFQPKLVAKNTKTYVKSKEQLFYYLHNTSKIKEMRLNKMIEEEYAKFQQINKKGTKAEFEQFLKRNDQYTSIVKKKQEILKQNSEKYDLKTGDKLFSPKISENRAYNFNSTASVKEIKKNPSVKTSNTPKINTFTPTNRDNNLNQNYNSNSKQKSSIFSKKPNQDNKSGDEIKNMRYFASTSKKPAIQQLGEEYIDNDEDLETKYKQYSHEYDQRNSASKESGYRSRHQIIPEESENSNINNSQQQFRGHPVSIHNAADSDEFNPDEDGQIIAEDVNVWGSNEIKPFELSNVNQYLNASEQDEQEHKNNYVMEILNNLMIRHEQEA